MKKNTLLRHFLLLLLFCTRLLNAQERVDGFPVINVNVPQLRNDKGEVLNLGQTIRAVRISVPNIEERSTIVVALDKWYVDDDHVRVERDSDLEAKRFVRRITDGLTENASYFFGRNQIHGIYLMRPLEDVVSNNVGPTGHADVNILITRGTYYGISSVTIPYDIATGGLNARNGLGVQSMIIMPDTPNVLVGFNPDRSRYAMNESLMLAHEMIHASDNLRGAEFDETVPVEQKLQKIRGGIYEVVMPIEGSEIMTTGELDSHILGAQMSSTKNRLEDWPAIKSNVELINKKKEITDRYPNDRGKINAINDVETGRRLVSGIKENILVEERGLKPRRHYYIPDDAARIAWNMNDGFVTSSLYQVPEGINITNSDLRDPDALVRKLGNIPHPVPPCGPPNRARRPCKPDPNGKVTDETRDRIKKVREFLKKNPNAPIYDGSALTHPDFMEQRAIGRPKKVYLSDSRGTNEIFRHGILSNGTDYSVFTDVLLGSEESNNSGWVVTTESLDQLVDKVTAPTKKSGWVIPGHPSSPKIYYCGAWVYEIDATDYFVSFEESARARGLPNELEVAAQRKEWGAIRKIDGGNIEKATFWEAAYEVTPDGNVKPEPLYKRALTVIENTEFYRPMWNAYSPYLDKKSGWNDQVKIFDKNKLDTHKSRGALEADFMKMAKSISCPAGICHGIDLGALKANASRLLDIITKDDKFMRSFPKRGKKLLSKAELETAYNFIVKRVKQTTTIEFKSPLQKAGFIAWVYNTQVLLNAQDSTTMDKYATILGIVPYFGEATGLIAAIQSGDPEAIIVNSLAVTVLLVSIVYPPLAAVSPTFLIYPFARFLIDKVIEAYSAGPWFTKIEKTLPIPDEDYQTILDPVSLKDFKGNAQAGFTVNFEVKNILPGTQIVARRVILDNEGETTEITKDVEVTGEDSKMINMSIPWATKAQVGERMESYDFYYRIKKNWGTFVSAKVLRIMTKYEANSFVHNRTTIPFKNSQKLKEKELIWEDLKIMRLTNKYPGLVGTVFAANIDAAFYDVNSWDSDKKKYKRIGFFSGPKFLWYDAIENTIEGGKKNIKYISETFPFTAGTSFSQRIDAASMSWNQKDLVYLIKGSQVATYNIKTKKDSIIPIKQKFPFIDERFTDKIDALTFDYETGEKATFLSLDRFGIYNFKDSDTKVGDAVNRWKIYGGLDLSTGFDAALEDENNITHFFKGSQLFNAQFSEQRKLRDNILISLKIDRSTYMNKPPGQIWVVDKYMHVNSESLSMEPVGSYDKQKAKATTFRVHASPKKAGCFRFESELERGKFIRRGSVNNPGWTRITLANDKPNNNTYLEQSTFCPKVDGSITRLEAFSSPGSFMMYDVVRQEFHIHKNSGGTSVGRYFYDQWGISDPWYASDVDFNLGTIAMLKVDGASGQPDEYLHYGANGARIDKLSETSSISDKQRAAFFIRQGLAKTSCYSFESVSNPGNYLYHSELDKGARKVGFSEREKGDIRNMTFCAFKLGTNRTRLETYNVTDGNLRRMGGEVWAAVKGEAEKGTGDYDRDIAWNITQPLQWEFTGLRDQIEPVKIAPGNEGIVPWTVANTGHQINGSFQNQVLFTAPDNTRFIEQNEVKHTVSKDGGKTWKSDDYYKTLTGCKLSEKGKYLTCDDTGRDRGWWGALGNDKTEGKTEYFVRYQPRVKVDANVPKGKCLGLGRGEMKIRDAQQAWTGGWHQLGDISVGGALKVCTPGFVEEDRSEAVRLAPGSEGTVPWMVANTGFELRGDYSGKMKFKAPVGATFPAQATVPFSYTEDGGQNWKEERGLTGCKVIDRGTGLSCDISEVKNHSWWGPEGNDKGENKKENIFRYQPRIRIDDNTPQGKYLDEGNGELEIKNALNARPHSWDQLGDIKIKGSLKVHTTGFLGAVDRFKNANIAPGQEGIVPWLVANTGYHVKGDFNNKVVFTAPDKTRFVEQAEVSQGISKDGGKSWITNENWNKLTGCVVSEGGKKLLCDNVGKERGWHGPKGDDKGKNKEEYLLRYEPKIRVDDLAQPGEDLLGRGNIMITNTQIARTGGWDLLGNVPVTGVLKVHVAPRKLEAGKETSLKVPGQDKFLRHQHSLARVDLISEKSPMSAKQDAGFITRSAESVSGRSCYSFESVNYPGRFLFVDVSDGNRVKLGEQYVTIGNRRADRAVRFCAATSGDGSVILESMLVNKESLGFLVREGNNSDIVSVKPQPADAAERKKWEINRQWEIGGILRTLMLEDQSEEINVTPGQKTTVTMGIANQGGQISADHTGKVEFTAPEGTKFTEPSTVSIRISGGGGRSKRDIQELKDCVVSDNGKKLTCNDTGQKDLIWHGMQGDSEGKNKKKEAFWYDVSLMVDQDAPQGKCTVGRGVETLVNTSVTTSNGVEKLGNVSVAGALKVCTTGFPGAVDRSEIVKLAPGSEGIVPWVVGNTGYELTAQRNMVRFTAPEQTTFPQQRSVTAMSVNGIGNVKALENCVVSELGKVLTCEEVGIDNKNHKFEWKGALGDRSGNKKEEELIKFMPKIKVNDDAPHNKCLASGNGVRVLKDVYISDPDGGQNIGDIQVTGALKVCTTTGLFPIDKVVTLQMTDNPRWKIRQQDGRGWVDEINSSGSMQDRMDATFILRKGNSDKSCYSLEAVYYPGQWLYVNRKHEYRQVKLGRTADAKASTFCMIKDKNKGKGIMLENDGLYLMKAQYLDKGRALRAANSSSGEPNFPKNAQWDIIDPLWDVEPITNLELNKAITLQSADSSLKDYVLRGTDGKAWFGSINSGSDARDRIDATFIIRASHNGYAFESINRPGNYLYVAEDNKVQMSNNPNAAASTFHAFKNSKDEIMFTNLSVNKKGIYEKPKFIWHENDKIWASPAGGFSDKAMLWKIVTPLWNVEPVTNLALDKPISLQATTSGFTDHVLRGTDGQGRTGKIDSKSDARDRIDATFTVRKGMSNNLCYSFESVNYPGQYLYAPSGD
ncbi:AbfB domain-containing protein, partial [Chryseobacterium sp. c4a]|uniref:AbfB domain-containing protein n=1 Tax=Chryseobacterium sp. c4a TaxID=1573582 RepID=UPI00135BAC72